MVDLIEFCNVFFIKNFHCENSLIFRVLQLYKFDLSESPNSKGLKNLKILNCEIRVIFPIDFFIRIFINKFHYKIMGQGYSKEEQRAVQKLHRMMDLAFLEDKNFDNYIKVRNQLSKLLDQKNLLVYKPVVDYIKSVIKSEEKNGEQKFRALLLFKDLLKSELSQMVIYSQTKILP